MLIDDHDRHRILAAIAEAEKNTAGEIVCLIARAASDWRMWPLAYAGLGALAVAAILILATDWSAGLVYVAQIAAFLVITLATAAPGARLALVPRSVKQERARRAAAEQFLARGLAGTRGRTGVLIYVAVAERSAHVIADRGIYEKVPPDVWREAVDELTAAIGKGRPADGILAAIARIGAVLAAHVPKGDRDVDELPNRLVEI